MNTELSNPLADLPVKRISGFEQAGGLMLAALATAAIGLTAALRRGRGAWLALSAISLGGAGGILWLFRNPRRTAPAGADAVIAACDGRITAISAVPEARFLHGAATCIEIATSLLQVQVNWAPGSGAIAYRRYEPSDGHAAADHDDSNWLGIERADGQRLLLRQVAARLWRPVPWQVARRIICWPDLSDHVSGGEVIGHLPLGGIVQIYVPIAAVPQVTRGQRIRGGETILALLAAKSAA